MKLTYLAPGHRLLPILTIALMTLWTGCNAGSLSSAETDPSAEVATLASMEIIESVEMTILNPGSAKEEQFVLSIALDQNAGVRYPEAFHILGMQEDGSVTLMEDTGVRFDAVAGDGIYSAPVDRSCLEEDTYKDIAGLDVAGKDFLKLTLTCEVDFVSPGEVCDGHGECPDTASRSFLWGLIEYDVDVVTCWCFMGCDVDVEFSFGKDEQPTGDASLSL